MARGKEHDQLDERLVEALVRLAEADFSVRLPRTYDRSATDALAFLVNTIAEELDASWQSQEQRNQEQEEILRVVSDGLMAMASGQFTHRITRSFDGSTSDVLAFLLNNTAQEVGELVDAREQRAAEVAALRSTRSADRLAAMGTLAAGAAHELATPLSSATIFIEEALTALAAERIEDAQVFLKDTKVALRRASELLNDLRIFGRETSTKVSEVQLDQVVLSATRLLRHEASNRCHIVLKTIPATVSASESRMAQVFVNLLQNALHSIEPGNKSKHTVTIAMHTEGPKVRVCVSDTGSGMSEEVLSRVFEPFFTTKGDLFGTGLGLSVSLATVEEFGGSIEMSSQVDVGTRVVVTLPLERSRARSRNIPEKPGGQASERLAILVVDDDSLLLKALQRVLAKEYEVHVASTGREALRRLEEVPSPAAVLCDVMMPEMTGPQFYLRVLASRPELGPRFLFLSGGAISEATRTFLNEVPHILKPVTPALLLARLRSHIRTAELGGDSIGHEPLNGTLDGNRS